MKIGILTYHWANNYGAVLQTYALLNMLKKLGHDVYLIDRVRTFIGWRRLYHRYSYKHYFSWYRFSGFNKMFLIPKTSRYISTREMKEDFLNYHFDAVVVGSDQVWRETFMGHNYFLDFVSGNCKKISYAASFGLSEWTLEESFTKKAKLLLQQFNRVSVREKTGVNICRKMFGVDAELVLDPTLLWNAEFYEKTLLNGKKRQEKSILVSYVLGKNMEQKMVAKKIALESKVTYIDLLGKKNVFQGHYTVEEWLAYIRDAKYVITNSFHATVFAILFHKQFVVLNNKSGGSDRISTLLGLLGLQHLFIESKCDVYKALKSQIDYCAIDKLLLNLRENSLNYLKTI